MELFWEMWLEPQYIQIQSTVRPYGGSPFTSLYSYGLTYEEVIV